MSMAEHDGADVARLDIETPHVLDHPLCREATVEEYVMGPARTFDADQHRKACLGSQWVKRRVATHKATRLLLLRARRTTRRPFIESESIEHTVHHARNGEGIDWLKRNRFDPTGPLCAAPVYEMAMRLMMFVVMVVMPVITMI